MSETLYIFSPSTHQLLPLKFREKDTFQVIIDQLKSKGNPHHLVYYDGFTSYTINPQDQIISLLPPRESQVLILTFKNEEDAAEFLAEVEYFEQNQFNRSVLLLINSDLSDIESILVPSNANLKNFFRAYHNLNGNAAGSITLTKFTDNNKTYLLDGRATFNEILPYRVRQVVLKIDVKPFIMKNFKNLHLLPESSRMDSILKYNSSSIITAHNLAKSDDPEMSTFKYLCQSNSFWEKLVERDFDLKGENRKTYMNIIMMEPNSLSAYGAKLKSMKIIKYALERGSTNYHDTLYGASLVGDGIMIEEFLDKVPPNNREWTYNQVLFGAALEGHWKIIEMIITEMGEKGIKIDYQNTLNYSAAGQKLEVFEHFLTILKGNSMEPWYFDMFSYAATGGNIEILKRVLLLMDENKINPIRVSFNNADHRSALE